MKLNHVTKKGDGELNEDSLIINERISLFGVADGVSSLVPFKSEDNLTGGYIASNMAKTYLETLTSTEHDLRYGLSKINECLYEKMKENRIDSNRKEQLWGTALAAVCLSEKGLEYIQTGDCMILAVYQTGEVRPLTRLQVEHLEHTAIEKWKRCIQEGMNKKDDIMPYLKEILIANRQLSNTDKGYGVLNGEPEAIDYVEYGKINRAGLKHLILLTDGLFPPSEVIPEGRPYWHHVAMSILENGIEQYADELIQLEETDSECIAYPRFKKSDDKAGIVIHF